jgi:hypothetical protein
MGTIRTRTTRKKGHRRGEEPRQARPARPARTAEPTASEVRERTGEDRVREAGGPQDTALYLCSCGKSFAGAVSTSVACPSCGTGQAW